MGSVRGGEGNLPVYSERHGWADLEADVQLAVSAEAARQAGFDTAGLSSRTTPIRGSQHPIDVVLLPRARGLLARFPAHPTT